MPSRPAAKWFGWALAKADRMSERRDRSHRTREDYQRGLPNYHDPTGGFGGAPPALSALTLRAWLAGFGVLVCAAGAVGGFLLHVGWFAVLLLVLAVISAVDLAWVLHRKARGEPG